MTIEEAVRFAEYAQRMARTQEMKEFYALAEAALKEQEEQENPKPLTLKELRQMDGEPVWMEDNKGNKCWGLVSVEDDGAVYCIDNETGLWEYCFYGSKFATDGWLAYRSKQKEDTK